MTARSLIVAAALCAAAILPAVASATASLKQPMQTEIRAGVAFVKCSGTQACVSAATRLANTDAALTDAVTKHLMARQTHACYNATLPYAAANKKLIRSLEVAYAAHYSVASQGSAVDAEVAFARTFVRVMTNC